MSTIGPSSEYPEVRNNDEEVKCKLLHRGLKKTPHPFWQHRENAMHKATEDYLREETEKKADSWGDGAGEPAERFL